SFFFQAEDGIRYWSVTGVQTCALPIFFAARMIASMIEDPAQATEEQIERWVADLDNWGICDCCCQELFRKTPFAHRKAAEWCGRPEEFVERAGFALIAKLAVHDKQASDDVFLSYLALVE